MVGTFYETAAPVLLTMPGSGAIKCTIGRNGFWSRSSKTGSAGFSGLDPSKTAHLMASLGILTLIVHEGLSAQVGLVIKIVALPLFFELRLK
jgi:hypothetical protein